MREVLSLNQHWCFTKQAELPTTLPQDWQSVNLPHTWNAQDGQDGGNDYYRGTCTYVRSIARSTLPHGSQFYLEFRGANASADVYWNGQHLAHHDGGYSTWRVNVTDALKDDNLLVVQVDNSVNDTVYPQMADFTFYGGLYRNVNLIAVDDSHFDLDYFGGPGLQVTPKVDGSSADIDVTAYVTHASIGQIVKFTIRDHKGDKVASCMQPASNTGATLRINNVHLWHGRKDPYLYTMEAVLLDANRILDRVTARFGCRTFRVDPEKGFFLNGESYPLRGVCRHQDRLGIGNALLPEYHREDVDLICEVGANTIRLAHYQHDQYFYDLCDERGLVIWAEIPYISKHMPNGRPNTISQMKELITQNYNHPCIVVWGLSNEITMNSKPDEDMMENHRILNDMVHEMDTTRLTTMAVVSMCDIHEPIVHLTDVVSYNLYFGWYGGDTSMNGPWLDKFHSEYPNQPIGMSEYGAEALNWHSSKPFQGDYTEEYQAHYHEELIKQLYSRPYLWATHVWNMFDFAADARSEGGENGQNHKGLVTIDRKYKKDAFYAYKAWLSDDPFVHLCSKRYIDRVEPVTRVTVYSNQPEVELFVNGRSLGKQTSPDHFFYFDVPNEGESILTAVAGSCRDESHIRKVDKMNEDYILKEKGAVLNWFDVNEVEGHCSINTPLKNVMSIPEGKELIMNTLSALVDKKDENPFMKDDKLMEMMGSFSFLRLTKMMHHHGKPMSREALLELNDKLNQIALAE